MNLLRSSEANAEITPLASLLVLGFLAALSSVAFLPRIALNEALFDAHVYVISAMVGWFIAVAVWSLKRGGGLKLRLNIMAPHYVQALIQLSIFIYWSWYWELIAHNGFLILSQVLFAFAFEGLLHWSRGKVWRLGFGPFPIIFSINLFLIFKDHWFVYQFLLIAVGLLAKEFVTWKRGERKVHIFNPSAITLFVFSLALIVTNNTELTWAEEIAIRLNNPPDIYIYIFVCGLIVQLLFHVTLVTLASALTLFLLNALYTETTGIYWFLDAGIPIAVFLGLHLLITDPATSPRNNIGRFLFGCLYGASVFFLYGLLEMLGEPSFYDKLLCVPVLNLLVKYLDSFTSAESRIQAFFGALPARFAAFFRPKALNAVFVVVWIGLFSVMYALSFVGPEHEGQSIAFWRQACANNEHRACQNLRKIFMDDCNAGYAQRCNDLNALYANQPELAKHETDTIYAYATGCEFGDSYACFEFVKRNLPDMQRKIREKCETDGLSCFVTASSLLKGLGVEADLPAAAKYFDKGCRKGLNQSCSLSADMYWYGVGVEKNAQQAIDLYQRACEQGYAPSCMRLSKIYSSGEIVEKNSPLARWYRNKACAIGIKKACGEV